MNDHSIQEYRPQSVTLVGAADILTQVKVIQEVMQAVMKPDVHYGIIPGTQKPSLWKPGAEVLCAVFRIADSYKIEDLSDGDSYRYRVTCIGTHQTSGTVMGEGIGSCSSNEKKYKWIKAYPREWDATAENRRRKVYGWDKQKRAEYEILQVRAERDDIDNTVLKMAAKRAKVAMVLNVTAASDSFSQDLEDLDERLRTMADERVEEALPALPEEKVEELKAMLNAATHRGELKVLLAKVMGIAKDAQDKEAHAAIKAYGLTLVENLPEAPIEGDAQ